MRITYVSHACLLFETQNSSIATDPWFDGPAFCDQWNVFPKPIDTSRVAAASTILISHPHEDHLHEPTLRRICQQPKKVFYPFYWYPETIGWLRSLALGEIIEARSGKQYQLDNDTTVTFIGAPGQNSIIVIESDGQVIVNVNDSLHSEPASLIDAYVRQMNRRWPNIDVLFCGFGGASYYPNALHAADKDDKAVARLREQLFIHNFCRIAHGLAPRLAIPFAADFVLLSPHQRWINDVRFAREEIPAYYAQHFPDNRRTTVAAMYPGDQIIDGCLQRVSPYRDKLSNGRLDHLIPIQYPDEISAFRVQQTAPHIADEWKSRLAVHLNTQTKFYSRRELEGMRFSLRLRDLSNSGWFDIRWAGTQFQVNVEGSPSPHSMANIETTTSVLEASIQNDWGGDALMIGYACDISVVSRQTAAKTRLCVSLLTRYPRPSSYALRYPVRTLDYLYQSAPMVAARVKGKIRSKLHGKKDEDLITSVHWLTGNLDAIRNACRLPQLDT